MFLKVVNLGFKNDVFMKFRIFPVILFLCLLSCTSQEASTPENSLNENNSDPSALPGETFSLVLRNHTSS